MSKHSTSELAPPSTAHIAPAAGTHAASTAMAAADALATALAEAQAATVRAAAALATAPIPATPSRELEEYATLVSRMMQETRRDEEPRVFSNKGSGHAKIVIDTMLASAKEHVQIFAKEMSCEVYDPTQIRAMLIRKPNLRMEVFVENRGALRAPTSALYWLRDLIDAGRICVLIAQGVPPNRNVCMVDNMHVRLERDQISRQATIFFGDKEIGQTAKAFFQGVAATAARFSSSTADA